MRHVNADYDSFLFNANLRSLQRNHFVLNKGIYEIHSSHHHITAIVIACESHLLFVHNNSYFYTMVKVNDDNNTDSVLLVAEEKLTLSFDILQAWQEKVEIKPG